MVRQMRPHSEYFDGQAAHFYRDVLRTLSNGRFDFLVGGGYALGCYTGILRDTKDLDIFVQPADARPVLDHFAARGYETDLKYPHWLGKIYDAENVIDVIFSSGNGLCQVDDAWFAHARDWSVLDIPVKLVPVEEMIWQKAFVMERHRFDGGDVVHLLHCCGESLDWNRLVDRFGPNWMVLLGHLIFARFAYPAHPTAAMRAVIAMLCRRLLREAARDDQTEQPGLCRGTLLSLLDYLPAIEEWGYRDARLPPTGTLTPSDIAHWTATFER